MDIKTKGWYIKELKKLGVSKIEGRKLEVLKTHAVANLYFKKTAQ